jgi:2-(1,2-epoxy-1,2-dihydrophenyl)acetyl-CoA isomerase
MVPLKYAGFEVERRENGVVWITFNRPERLNGMNQAFKRDLVEYLAQAQMDDTVRVLVFTGRGRAFCAGDDLNGWAEGAPTQVPALSPGHTHPLGTYGGLRVMSQAVNRAVRDLDKITIAAINGYAIQTGLSLALCCDFRVASSDAVLGSATLRFGLLPDEGGQWLLVRLLGLSTALDFVLRKRMVSAVEALRLGLVNEITEPQNLEGVAANLALEMAEGPQVAMRLLKRSMYAAEELSFTQGLEDIAIRTAVSDHHPDAAAGVSAFRSKTVPQFNAWLEDLTGPRAPQDQA